MVGRSSSLCWTVSGAGEEGRGLRVSGSIGGEGEEGEFEGLAYDLGNWCL